MNWQLLMSHNSEMWTYHWYLIKKNTFPQYDSHLGDWLLICPDFPDMVITDQKLGKSTAIDVWNTAEFTSKAKVLTECIIQKMLKDGDTIPTPQKQVPGYFSFKIDIPYVP